jgi:hypothetical protein
MVMETHARSDGSESSVWDAEEDRKLLAAKLNNLLYAALNKLKNN